jgi:hypothetical protein
LRLAHRAHTLLICNERVEAYKGSAVIDPFLNTTSLLDRANIGTLCNVKSESGFVNPPSTRRDTHFTSQLDVHAPCGRILQPHSASIVAGGSPSRLKMWVCVLSCRGNVPEAIVPVDSNTSISVHSVPATAERRGAEVKVVTVRAVSQAE